jgi:hypothetical protein
MPWTGGELARKHNHALVGKTKKAAKAASQANAILQKTGDEGLALAVANKNAKRSNTPKTGGIIGRSMSNPE